MNKLSKHALPS